MTPYASHWIKIQILNYSIINHSSKIHFYEIPISRTNNSLNQQFLEKEIHWKNFDRIIGSQLISITFSFFALILSSYEILIIRLSSIIKFECFLKWWLNYKIQSTTINDIYNKEIFNCEYKLIWFIIISLINDIVIFFIILLITLIWLFIYLYIKRNKSA